MNMPFRDLTKTVQNLHFQQGFEAGYELRDRQVTFLCETTLGDVTGRGIRGLFGRKRKRERYDFLFNHHHFSQTVFSSVPGEPTHPKYALTSFAGTAGQLTQELGGARLG